MNMAVPPIITSRTGEDAAGAVYEYIPPNIVLRGGAGGGPDSPEGLFVIVTGNNFTLTIPGTFAILDM